MRYVGFVTIWVLRLATETVKPATGDASDDWDSPFFGQNKS